MRAARHRAHRKHRPVRVLAVAALAASAVTAPALLSTAGADPVFTEQNLHFRVFVGPDRSQECDIVGILVTPTVATSSNKVPAILTTNGFGGSASDQVPFAEKEAALGYVVLSYSGLGFGGSDCKITLDDPDWDGVAASQLVSYLGGASGIAFLDDAHTQPAPTLDVVKRDVLDHNNHLSTNDPRVGMWGGSYGGEIQFAAASVDARIDAINPQITWNDLSYSLGPNNTNQTTGVSTGNPGAVKVNWGLGFSAEGIFDGAQNFPTDESRFIGCPNFADFVCPALVTAGTTGYFQPGDIAHLRHASVSSYLSKIKIPVLLDQGQTDTLFQLNEAVATYKALKAQNNKVAMLWREQGHSGGTPTDAGRAYENTRIQNWFDHYLKGSSVGTGSAFAYYRDWTGTFAEANSYPVGSNKTYYLTAANALTSSVLGIKGGSQTFVTPPAGAPTTLGPLDALGGVVPVPPLPDTNVQGTYAYWSTPALSSPLTVVGAPLCTVKISAPSAELTSGDPAGQVVLFAKIYDVAPDGTASLIKGLVAPIRVPDPTKAIKITLPAIAHQFAAGHSIKLMIAGGDVNYRGGLTPTAVTISTGSTGQTLVLPTV